MDLPEQGQNLRGSFPVQTKTGKTCHYRAFRQLSSLQNLRAWLESGETQPLPLAEEFLAKANGNSGRNVYLTLDKNWTRREAQRVSNEFSGKAKPALFALPVSLKDCFDLAGFPTTAGTRFYAEKNEIAHEDSAVAARLRQQGAIITGKTHLHPLAYGITGENPDFGDCLQPENSSLLTGGSTSGGAASVQEGSAVAAIGTDTGGSIRVPAALCGLAGYRASVGLAWERKLWSGGVHLSQTFDTLGWIFGDLRDGPLLAEGLFGLRAKDDVSRRVKVAAVSGNFLRDCESNVQKALELCKSQLVANGAEVAEFEADDWDQGMSIYAPIQASEAAAIHAPATGGDFSGFPPPLNERLAWGASLSKDEIQSLRARHSAFRERVDTLCNTCDFLLLPCSPLSQLKAGTDHSETRMKMA